VTDSDARAAAAILLLVSRGKLAIRPAAPEEPPHRCTLQHVRGRRWVCSECLLPVTLGESPRARAEEDLSCSGRIDPRHFGDQPAPTTTRDMIAAKIGE
jgi:hypothetical protein